VPDTIDDAGAAMLEPLGIAIHAVDLARIRVANSVAIVGAGPIGLLILQLARLSGAAAIFVSDRLGWRLDLARRLGAVPINYDEVDPVRAVLDATGGRGVDVAIEAAWSDHSVQQAAEMARMGGRLVLVGIPGDDRLELNTRPRGAGLTSACRGASAHLPRAIADQAVQSTAAWRSATLSAGARGARVNVISRRVVRSSSISEAPVLKALCGKG
jgi:L-iditol 2-dehydrogenase